MTNNTIVAAENIDPEVFEKIKKILVDKGYEVMTEEEYHNTYPNGKTEYPSDLSYLPPGVIEALENSSKGLSNYLQNSSSKNLKKKHYPDGASYHKFRR